MIGQSDCLTFPKKIDHWKYNNIDLSPLLYKEEGDPERTKYCSGSQDHGLDKVLDQELLKIAKKSLDTGAPTTGELEIQNTDRSTGTMLSNEISKKYEAEGLANNTIQKIILQYSINYVRN